MENEMKFCLTWIYMKLVLIITTLIVLVLLTTFALSHFQSKQRIEMLEYQQHLLAEELTTLLHDENKQSLFKSDMLRRIERGRYLLHLNAYSNMEKVINEFAELKTILDSKKYLDTIGRADYALESAGGKILSIGKTKLVTPCNKLWNFFTKTIFSTDTSLATNSPRFVIQPSIFPGECFAFEGRGEIIIKLVKLIFIDSVSIEHILPQMSPDRSITNAPYEFNVYGMQEPNDLQPTYFGKFFYRIIEAQPLQVFYFENFVGENSYPIIRFEIISNHGNANNTCVYRIRVHGSLIKSN